MLYCDKSLFPIGNLAGEDVVSVIAFGDDLLVAL